MEHTSTQDTARKPDLASELMTWWERYSDDPSVMAPLRRCSSVDDVFLQAAFWRFLDEFNSGVNEKARERIAFALMVLAYIKSNASDENFGTQLGYELSGSASGQRRFRKMYEVQDGALGDLVTHLVRFIRRLRGTANVRDVAKIVLEWPRCRRQLAMDFFQVFRAEAGSEN